MSNENNAAEYDVDAAASELHSLLPDDAFDRDVYDGELKAPEGEQEEEEDRREALGEGEPADDDDEEVAESEESEEADSEDDDADVAEEEDGDEDSEDAEDEAPQTFRVKVGGEESDVTLEELVNGYQRQADYTRKTMKLSEERKGFESEMQAVRAARDEYSERLGELKSLLDRAKPAEPDWAALKKENPAHYAQAWAEWQQQQQLQTALDAEQSRIKEEQQKEEFEQFKAKLAEEQQKLVTAIPEWKDNDVRKSESKELVEFAEEFFGLSKEEVAQFTDHRALVMLRMAMKYNRLQQKGKKVVKDKGSKAPVLRPGKPKLRKAQRSSKKLTRASKRLSETGHFDDAQAFFEEALPDDF